MKEIQEGMTAAQVSATIMGNFSEVSEQVAEAKRLTAAEEERAKGAEQDLLAAVAQNVGDIKALREVAATKEALSVLTEQVDSNQQGVAKNAEDIVTERQRSIAAEQSNADAIEAEKQRAIAAEGEIRGSVESLGEDLNAASEDISKLEVALEAEVRRAKAAEQALGTEITEAENRVDERVTEVRDSLEAEVQARSAAVADLEANTGISEYAAFDPAVDYVVGDVVVYEGRLKKFTAEHAAGEWIGTDVEKWSERKEREDGIIEIKENLKSESFIDSESFDGQGAITSNGIETATWESYRYTTKPIHLIKGQTISVKQYLGRNAYFLSVSNAGTYKPLVEGTGVNPYVYEYTADADIDVYVCVYANVIGKVSISTPYARLSHIEERIDKNSECDVKAMIIGEAFELTSATRTNGLVTSANVLWANGEIGSIILVRDNEGLVTKYSGAIGSHSFTMTINRDNDGNVVKNQLTIN